MVLMVVLEGNDVIGGDGGEVDDGIMSSDGGDGW